MRPRVYLETTIPSLLTAWPSRDLVIAGKQRTTRDWREKRAPLFELVASEFVLDEVRAGDPDAARLRVEALRSVSLLEVTDEVRRLSKDILDTKLIPAKAQFDAAHIAICSVHQVDYLLTWNCTHIANAMILKDLEQVCLSAGYELPVICTPDELMGEQHGP